MTRKATTDTLTARVPLRVLAMQELRRSGAPGPHRTRVPRGTARRAAIAEQLA